MIGSGQMGSPKNTTKGLMSGYGSPVSPLSAENSFNEEINEVPQGLSPIELNDKKITLVENMVKGKLQKQAENFVILQKEYLELEDLFEAKCDEVEITQEQQGDMIEALQDEVEEWKEKFFELQEKHSQVAGIPANYGIVQGMSD